MATSNHALDSSRVMDDVLAERGRQVYTLGYDACHDDRQERSALAAASFCYTLAAVGQWHGEPLVYAPSCWPFSPDTFRPSGVRRSLIKSIALLVAEVERFDRINARVHAEGVRREY